MIRNTLKKSLLVLLALTFCVCLLPSCTKKTDPLAKSGFSSLMLDEKNRVNAEIVLDSRTLQAHTGQRAFLYERLPDEEITAITSRDPLGSAKVASSLDFRFDLKDGDRTRLYSTFYVVFTDGTLLSNDGFWIENPEKLATDRSAFPWSKSPKGICMTNAELAAELGSMHVMLHASVTELMADGTQAITFGGDTYAFSPSALATLDKQVIDATNAGLQVSLTLSPDGEHPRKTLTAVLDMLAERYSKSTGGKISAVFLDTDDSMSPEDAAAFCRAAHQAFRSRIANSRVFVLSERTTLTETKTFFSNLRLQLSVGGDLKWGAAVTPVLSETPWEQEDEDTMSVNNLSNLNDFLSFESADTRSDWFAVCGLSFAPDNENRQAAAFAYAYREAVAATASMIFYDTVTAPENGFFSEANEARRILSLYSNIDTVQTQEDRILCERTIGKAWTQKSVDLISRTTLTGIANVGTAGYAEQAWFDFSSGETFGFTSIGGSTPTSFQSGAWDSPVLSTWIDPSAGVNGGVRKKLNDASSLEGSVSLSAWLLTAQAGNAERCLVRLVLEGESNTGMRVTYHGDVEVSHGQWQLVTFQIADFVAEADLSRPVIIALTTSPDVPAEDNFVFYLKDLYVRAPDQGCGSLLPMILIIACAAVSAAVILLVYMKSAQRRR